MNVLAQDEGLKAYIGDRLAALTGGTRLRLADLIAMEAATPNYGMGVGAGVELGREWF